MVGVNLYVTGRPFAGKSNLWLELTAFPDTQLPYWHGSSFNNEPVLKELQGTDSIQGGVPTKLKDKNGEKRP
jgi:hypothetical protein